MKDFSTFLDEQEKEANQFLDKIERTELYVVLLDNFLAADINCLSFDETIALIKKLKTLNITPEEQEVIVSMFKHYSNLYYDKEYGFILFLNLNCLSDVNKNNKKNGFVYICRSDIGLHKIGCSTNPQKRVKDLGLGSSIRHTIIHTIKTNDMFKLEKLLHHKFESKKEHSEWFCLNDKDIEYIKGL